MPGRAGASSTGCRAGRGGSGRSCRAAPAGAVTHLCVAAPVGGRSGSRNSAGTRRVRRRLAGAPGFEPGNGGTKNRCLTAWLRPIRIGRRTVHRMREPRTRVGTASPEERRVGKEWGSTGRSRGGQNNQKKK